MGIYSSLKEQLHFLLLQCSNRKTIKLVSSCDSTDKKDLKEISSSAYYSMWILRPPNYFAYCVSIKTETEKWANMTLYQI